MEGGTLQSRAKTYIGEGELLTVIHGGDGDLALRHVIVVVDVIGQSTHFCWGQIDCLVVDIGSVRNGRGHFFVGSTGGLGVVVD